MHDDFKYRVVLYVSVFVVAFVVAYVWLAPKQPVNPAHVEPVPRIANFEQRFNDQLLPVVRVRTIPVGRTPTVPVDEPIAITPPGPVVRLPVPRPSNVDGDALCRKHGMRKVVTEGGKSWRCRK